MSLLPDLLDWVILIFQQEGYNNPVTSAGIFIVIIIMGLVGTLICYFGYRLYKFFIGLFALIVGFMLGIVVSAFFANSISSVIIIGVITGIVLCIISVKIYYIGIFAFAGFWGFLLVYLMTQDYTISAIVGIIIGVIVAIFHKVLLVIFFSISGAYILTNASAKLFSFIIYQANIDLPYVTTYIVQAIFFVIYVVTGMIYQFKRAKKYSIDKNEAEIQQG